MQSDDSIGRTVESEDCKWNCRDVARQLVDIQRVMSTSLLTLVKALEDDVVVGITPEKVPAIRDKYASLSRKVQELSVVSEPPLMKTLTKSSSNAALSWASDYFTNLKNVIDNDKTEENNQHSLEQVNNVINQNVTNYITFPEIKQKRSEESKGIKSWFRRRFGSSSEDSTQYCINEKKRNQKSFITIKGDTNTFTEKYKETDKPQILVNSSVSVFDVEGSLPKLCVFDNFRRPLTDLRGNVLKDAFGHPLVLFDAKGRPVDRNGAPVFDSRGLPSTGQGFSPTENHRITKLSPIALFDAKGYPLTGKDGHVLLDPSDETVVKFCRQGKDGLILCEKDGGGVWDNKGIPVCSIHEKWLDQEGRPFRLFLENGMPVTDSKGRELYNIDGESLLMRDPYGRPYQVHDTFGVPISEYAFDGTLHPPCEIETFCCLKSLPLKLYNSNGHPLTDEDGRVLFDSFGNPLLRVDFHNNPMKGDEGTNIYDEKKFPLFCNPAQPILNMDGKPLHFYDKNKKPLTDRRGIPLVHASGVLLLKLDSIGRPFADQRGKPLCDINGNEMSNKYFEPTISPTVNPSQLQITFGGKPGFIVYEKSGRPLTDVEGNALVNSDGTTLEFNIVKQKRKELKQEYDNFGRPLFDRRNRNLYCHGKPLFDMFGHKILDIDFEEEETADYVRCGNFNKYGMPVCDKYLRVLYDEKGMPLCDKTGTPESKIVRDCDGILLSVTDNMKIIKVPKERALTLKGLSIKMERLIVGFPKECCTIPEEWIISSSQSEEEILPEREDGWEYFLALIRTSNLSILQVIHEILAIYSNKI